MKTSLLMTLILWASQSFGISFIGSKKNEKYLDCHSSREFITSVKFLKAEEVYPEHSDKVKELALQIMEGCVGATQRFKDVFLTLDKAGFPRAKTVEVALEFTKHSDAQAKSFCLTFQKAYLKKYLDLTPADALKLARSMAAGIDKKVSIASDDFEKAVAFCINNRKVDLPKRYCAERAIALAQYADRYGESLFGDFKDTYFWFLKSFGKDISAPKAIEQALKVVSYGPKSSENFIRSFEFVKKSDMLASKTDQVELALRISSMSHLEKKEKDIKK